jgi:hypothetical protein
MSSSLCAARAPTAAPRAAPRVRARGATRAARGPRAVSVVTETSVLYTSADLAKDAPPSASEAVETREEKTKLAPDETPSARTPTPRFEDSVVTLERDSRAMSAPWVPFSPSGSVCFEVALDARDGWASFGLDFEPGPDGRPRVAAVAETGAAFGEVKVGDVVLETCEVIMVETRDVKNREKKVFVPQRRWRDSKDGSFEECLNSMRSVVAFGGTRLSDENAGETNNGAETSLVSEPSPSYALSMRLCRDYVGANAIPMRGEADVEADVRWVDHDGSMEWNEEAIVSGKEWAARHAAGGF